MYRAKSQAGTALVEFEPSMTLPWQVKGDDSDEVGQLRTAIDGSDSDQGSRAA